MLSLTPQSLFLSLLLLVSIFFLIFNLQKWRSSSQSLKPPSPPSLPIIGHLHLLTDMPHHSLAQLAQKLGPIIHLQLGRVPTIVVSSAHLAKLVLKTHDHVFASRPNLLSAQYLSFNCSDVTFSPYGPYWRQARKICVTELLSSKRVSSFQLVRDEEVNRLLGSVSAQSGSELDLGKMFFALANDVLCRVAFGKRFKEESGEDEGQKRHLVGVLTETQALFAGFCLGDFFPGWDWVDSLSGYTKRLSKNLEDLRAVCEEIIEEHVKEQGVRSGKEDFVDVLLRVQQREDLEVPITDDNLKALVLTQSFLDQGVGAGPIATLLGLACAQMMSPGPKEDAVKWAYSSLSSRKNISLVSTAGLTFLICSKTVCCVVKLLAVKSSVVQISCLL